MIAIIDYDAGNIKSVEKALKTLPVFDWGENDFNFNVPVNIDAEEKRDDPSPQH